MIITSRKDIAAHYGVGRRVISMWMNEQGMPHTKVPDEHGNPIPKIDTDTVDKWLIDRIKKKKDRLALAKKRG